MLTGAASTTTASNVVAGWSSSSCPGHALLPDDGRQAVGRRWHDGLGQRKESASDPGQR